MERGTSEMRVEILADADAVAGRAAALVAREAHDALVRRGRFVLALSGGRTPERFWRALARETVPWDRVDLVQVDERVAARDDPDRNWTGLERRLVAPASLPPERTHPMPVEAVDLAAAARSYADLLARLAGTPPVLDLVQLGLGADGHTASLVPGDPVLRVRDADVASTGPHAGRRRMTLTFPALDRARRVLWIVCGAAKADVLARLVAGDPALPASAVRRDRALLLADRAAAARLPARREAIAPEPGRSPSWPDPSPTTR